MVVFACSLAIIAAGGIVSVFLSPAKKHWALFSTAIPAAILIIYTCVDPLSGNVMLETVINMPLPFGQIPLRIDSVSAFFLVITSLIYPVTVLFAGDYLYEHSKEKDHHLTSHWLMFSLFTISMMLVFTVQSVLAFVFVWEIMSLVSLLLLIFKYKGKDVQDAAVNYFTTMHVGVVFLIIGFILASQISGNSDFASFKNALQSSEHVTLIFILLLTGFGIKAGWFPFHSWLPIAHPAAPSHISAMMSGLMIKTGIYGIIRTIEFTGTANVHHALTILAVASVTILYAVINGMTCSHIKKTLAFSSVENSAIIGLGIAAAMLGLYSGSSAGAFFGFAGAMIHFATHAVNKSALFLSSGFIHMHTGSFEMGKGGGMSKTVPLFSKLFLISSLSISGMPFLSGFFGKFAIFISLMITALKVEFSLSVIIISVCAVLAFSSSVGAILYMKLNFFISGGDPSGSVNIPERSRSAIAALLILTAVSVFTGFCPMFLFRLVHYPAAVFIGSNNYFPELSFLVPLTLLPLVFVVSVLLLMKMRKKLAVAKDKSGVPTWGCAYKGVMERGKYTSWSFSEPFIALFRKVAVSKETLDMADVFFPSDGSFLTSSDDAVNLKCITPLVKGLRKFLDLFSWIQSSDGRKYILYIIVFLLITLFWIMGV